MNTQCCAGLTVAAAISALAADSTLAQELKYPLRHVRMVAPFPPGVGTDIAAWLVMPRLSETLGQPIVIDNRGGANGGIGTDIVAKAQPDGYTVVVSGIGTLAINFAMYSKIPYDPVRDFADVTQIAGVPNMLVVNPSLNVNSVKELIALGYRKFKCPFCITGNVSAIRQAVNHIKI